MPNLRHALRTLTKTPFVSAVAILSLALGIGANTAIFSLFDQMLLRPLPASEPERLVNLEAPGPKPGSQSCNQAGSCDVVFSYPMFRDLQRMQQSFTGIAAHVSFGANLAQDGLTESGRGMLVSGSYFPVLGVQPALGRLFSPADDQNIGAHFVAVLDHDYWDSHLGRDPDILNKTIVVNGQSLTIVGVAPRGFTGTTLGFRPDVYVPLTMRALMLPGWEGFENRRSYWAYLFARLKPDVSIEQARASLNTIYHGIVNDVEAPLQSGMSDPTMERFRAKDVLVKDGRRGQSQIHAEARTPIILLFSITAIVLLIACANIANLLLARGAQRAHEMAIRGSLGGSRAQLLTQLLTESCLLAVLGGVASVFVAYWTLSFIASLLPPEAVQMMTVELRPSALVFAAVLAVITGLLFGMYPAFYSTRPDLIRILRASTGQPSGARGAARFRNGLVTAQIALSMALLVSAGLFLRSLVNVSRIDLGLDTDDVVTFRISPELNGYEFAAGTDLFLRAEEELAAIPGVIAVSDAMVPLLAGSSWGNDVSVEGFESGPDVDANARFNAVGPEYFRTVGIQLLGGREFTRSDNADAPRVAVINEAFARKFGLDPREAVGKRMARGRGDVDLDTEIIGVVQDAKYSEVKEEVPPLFFLPYLQTANVGSLSFYVRTGIDPAQILRAIPQVVNRLDPNLPVEELKTLEQQARESVFLDRMISTLSTAFAALATLLAAVGLYGVLAYSVAQRTREIGVRMALGAEAGRVRGLVLRQVGWMLFVGGAVGIAAALALGRGAQSLLYEMGTHDPVVIALSVVVLSAVALSAGYLPALRASKVDPMQALRYE